MCKASKIRANYIIFIYILFYTGMLYNGVCSVVPLGLHATHLNWLNLYVHEGYQLNYQHRFYVQVRAVSLYVLAEYTLRLKHTSVQNSHTCIESVIPGRSSWTGTSWTLSSGEIKVSSFIQTPTTEVFLKITVISWCSCNENVRDQ